MKTVINEYIVKCKKLNESHKVLNISDIHSNVLALKNIIDMIEEILPDIITMPGDVIDSVDDYCIKEMYKKILELCKKYRTYISIGNHDTVKFTKEDGKRKEVDTSNYEFFEDLKKEGTNVIYNTKECLQATDDIDVYAINPSVDWYQRGEDKTEFMNLINQYVFDENKFNILLSHTPNCFIHSNKLICDSNIDLILSGHNHGGLTPQFLKKFSKDNIGLVGPYGKILFKNAYGMYSNGNTSLIISDGVTKIANSNEWSLLANLVNSYFTPAIDILNLEPAKENTVVLSKRYTYKNNN